MNCDEIQELLDPLVDGELRDIEAVSVNKHLQHCRNCKKALAELVQLREMLAAVPGHQVPESLERLVANKIFDSNSEQLQCRDVPRKNGLARLCARGDGVGGYRPWLFAGSHLAAAVCGMLVFFAVTQLSVEPDEVIADASTLVNHHVRALIEDKPTQILAGEPHDVKPWFAGQIDYSPPVRDFAAQGFPLVGGRIDNVDGHLMAVLVYKRRKHWISVLIAPQSTDASADIDRSRQRFAGLSTDDFSYRGYQVAGGRHDDFEFRVVSDLNHIELSRLLTLLSTDG